MRRHPGSGDEDRGDEGGCDGDGSGIAGDPRRPQPAPEAGERGSPECELRLESRPALADEVEAGIGDAFAGGAGPRFLGDAPGDLVLRMRAAARQLLDGASVHVARREVHVAIALAGPEHRIDERHALEPVHPVDVGDETHAGEYVAHADVGRRLALVLFDDRSFERHSLLRQPPFEPCRHLRAVLVPVAQPLGELHREGVRKRIGFEAPEEFADVLVAAGRLGRQELVGETVGCLALGPRLDDAVGKPPQVLDEDDAQRDGDRPQFADGQFLDALICAHEPGEDVGIEQAVRVGDIGPGDAQHPRIARERSLGELRQLLIVAGRQILADLADLHFHDVVVVDKPLGGRRDRTPAPDRIDQRPVVFEEGDGIFIEAPGDRPPLDRQGGDRLRPGEADRMLLQALGIEELRSDGLDVVPWRLSFAPSEQPRDVVERLQRCERSGVLVLHHRETAIGHTL